MVDEFLPLKGIALQQMLERLPVIADIGPGLAQCEVEPDLLFGAQRFHLAGQVLHGRKMWIARGHPLGGCKNVIKTGGGAGRGGNRFFEPADRLVHPAQSAQRDAQIPQGVAMIGLDCQRLFALRDRFADAPEMKKHEGGARMSFGVGRIDRRGLLIVRQRLLRALHGAERIGEVQMRFGILRRQRQRLFAIRNRLLMTVLHGKRARQIAERFGIVRPQR